MDPYIFSVGTNVYLLGRAVPMAVELIAGKLKTSSTTFKIVLFRHECAKIFANEVNAFLVNEINALKLKKLSFV